MKISAAVVCFLLLAGSLSARAQEVGRFNVPFDFTSGSQVMPAGTYVVSQAIVDNNAAWIIHDNNGDKSLVMTNALASPLKTHRTSMIFRHDGGQYSLIEFWLDTTSGRSVIRPKTSDVRIAQSKPEVVEIAALQR